MWHSLLYFLNALLHLQKMSDMDTRNVLSPNFRTSTGSPLKPATCIQVTRIYIVDFRGKKLKTKYYVKNS